MMTIEEQIDRAVYDGDWEAAAQVLDDLGRTDDANRIRNSFMYAHQQFEYAWADFKAALLDTPLVRWWLV
ncbi:hypothetical protein LCGC14_2207920 [marine sediment metagenome]|uniref:Uncharacterized protein n=1 Tax=marine sediment metagenome TaxID=412755 RepID=A0A0F9E237_9ZZZZ